MSWKSLVSAGLLCVVASPALAVPQLNVNLAGLNTAGNWVWDVSVTPTAAGTPLGVELGFKETGAGALIAASRNTGNFDTVNPGTKIFGWEAEVDTDPGTGVNMRPEGLQVNVPTDEVFAALGSIDFTTGGAKDMLDITVQRPTTTRLSTTLQWLGKYGTGGVNGRIAEMSGTTATNTDTFAGSATKGVRGGNANLSPAVDVGDLAILAGNYNQPSTTKRWQDADFTGNGMVDVGDLAVLASNYNQPDADWTTTGSTTIPATPGSGAVVAAAPEPTTLGLLAICGLFAAAVRRGRTR